ncbi:TVP38/TMEM64 family protein [Catellatospora sp. KI3]|uniref:TVP38/TMEM64 family protein n=1 Tax=Catellatospora sp. KI3 TaxID=3041620 RepID=UPI0024832317|nr:TVP38/TMEM64 family protein [Catellatospora sp. KI3]MDI1464875.1 TVP38/TMEM64 family protein [Catellatospora sp. KI3]
MTGTIRDPRPAAAATSGRPDPAGAPSAADPATVPAVALPEPPQAGRPLVTHWRRAVGLALLVVAAAVGAWLLPLERLPAWVDQLGPSAPVVAVLVCAGLLSALVPRTAISLGCGALFGAVMGATWSMAAALIAAAFTYAAGRWAGRDLVAARAGDRLQRLDRWLTAHGLLAVVVVRLQPIAPFGLVGYAYGTSTTRFRHYLLGTLIGGVPSSFSYATIGAAAVAPHTLSWLTFVPAASGLLISAAAALHWRRQSLRNRPLAPA